jgi:Transposase
MKKSRCTDQQIASVLQQAEAGSPVPGVCRKMGVYEPIFYLWKQKYGGLMPSEVKNIGVPGLRNRLDLHRRPISHDTADFNDNRLKQGRDLSRVVRIMARQHTGNDLARPASTEMCCVGQDRRALPCVSSGRSPRSKIFEPVLTIRRWMGPASADLRSGGSSGSM